MMMMMHLVSQAEVAFPCNQILISIHKTIAQGDDEDSTIFMNTALHFELKIRISSYFQ